MTSASCSGNAYRATYATGRRLPYSRQLPASAAIPSSRRRRPLFIALHPDSPVTAAAVAMASVGLGASLVQQERLVSLSPDGPTGYVLGLQSSGMMTLQGVSAVILTVASVSSTARTRYDLPARASSPEHHLPIRSGRVRSASPAGRPEAPTVAGYGAAGSAGRPTPGGFNRGAGGLQFGFACGSVWVAVPALRPLESTGRLRSGKHYTPSLRCDRSGASAGSTGDTDQPPTAGNRGPPLPRSAPPQ